MKHRFVRRVSALALAGCLLAGSSLPAFAAASAAKEEVIYANLTASGVVTASAGDGGKTGLTSGGSSADTSLQGIKIAVKNGSGINGCASSAASKLTPLGAVVETGNADDFKYKETLVIYNNPSDQAKAQAIADALGVGSTKKNNGVYSFAGDYLVVVGADWK